jgi:hypothetical protein
MPGENINERIVRHIGEAAAQLRVPAPEFAGFTGITSVLYSARNNQLTLNESAMQGLSDEELRAVLSNLVGMARFRIYGLLLPHANQALNASLLVLGVLTLLGKLSATGFLMFFGFLVCWTALTRLSYRPVLLHFADRFTVRFMGSGQALANGLLKIAARTGNAEFARRQPRMQRLLNAEH